ncbi:hypothetical protein TEA_001328 [Camellia sinensis var. sinensis]|uniref:NAD(P)H-hydrate epimerase n=1 Tax=Camellia sinensis var. sinensis TaxID=542762 RepID=A0A4S4DE94_CAMSN|nr:hypothetical protein TEA_001328 [Camellia sinensis var. sinensis]
MASRPVSSLQSLNTWDSISYLSQREAAEIDDILMGPLGFSVDQLMELAGLSVATAIAEVYRSTEYNRVLAICGPGNNGGDGLVAARHLHHFGYNLSVCYPKRTPKPLYDGLVTQLESLCVPFLSVEDLSMDLSNDFDILVDAMFGFSFRAPKLCAKRFCGPHHFLGGRFVPPSIVDKYKLQLPPYPGTSMCVRIGKPSQIDISALRENYISPEFLEDQVEDDPFNQIDREDRSRDEIEESIGARQRRDSRFSRIKLAMKRRIALLRKNREQVERFLLLSSK